ncbi:MAG: SAM-dependent methyltransferase [Candidatus Scalindua sp.]|nr:SAM-dependent methyltransferase [Candidatus Scalindua sp.]
MNRVTKGGLITFADFMDMALYHPEYGYYTSTKERIGRKGDYYTSSDVHPLFGQLIARQLEQMWRILGMGMFTVVEMGAGKGLLCYDIITFIKKCFPEFFEVIEYKIVEINKDQVENQSNLLKGFASKISWESFSADGFSFEPVKGCFLSNEFVDSLPVHRLIVEDGRLKEIYVGHEDGEFCEIVGELSVSELEEYFMEFPVQLKEGQEAEVNLRAVDWISNMSRSLNKGFVITIDYGYRAVDIYSEDKFKGTLMCYHKHSTNENPFVRVGDQDITSHVNFSSLIKAGEKSGLSTTGFTKQSHFLIALGAIERMIDSPGDIRRVLAIKNLILPGGMGEVFKVLIQHKSINNPELTGLRVISELGLIREIEALENR